MILSLRQRHRHMFAVIGVLLPVAFVVGIAARKPVPANASLPAGLSVSPEKFFAPQWERGDLFARTPIKIRLLRETANSGRFALQFLASKGFQKADLLVYWVAGSPKITDLIPDDAILLGAFNPFVFLAVPSNLESAGGVLVLYSLADHEVVETSKPFGPR